MQIEFPVWLEPTASQNTPMSAALSYTFNLVSEWVSKHPNAFPPIIIHITDGEPNDGDPRNMAEALRNLSSSDGNVLLFNLHLSAKQGNAVVFPSTMNQLPDDYAKMLFEISSELPDKWFGMASEMGLAVSQGSRAFVFNADLAAMVRFLEIGTRQPTAIKQ
jgi:hypothetical protein